MDLQALMNELPEIIGAVKRMRGHVDAHNEVVPALADALGEIKRQITGALAELGERVAALENDLRALRTELGNAPEPAAPPAPESQG